MARFVPFLKNEQPDVVCLQEILQVDVKTIAAELQMQASFAPVARVDQENQYGIAPLGEWGIAFFTRLPHSPVETYYYKGEGTIPQFTTPNSIDRAVLVSEVEKDNQKFRIATTHFTWSEKGEFSEEQEHDFQNLRKVFRKFDELILCGDFNAPRGREMFARFTEHFIDTLPQRYLTTLDPDLHYAGPLELAVDTIFSTPHYEVKNVRLVSGVSDHQAVVGEVTVR